MSDIAFFCFLIIGLIGIFCWILKKGKQNVEITKTCFNGKILTKRDPHIIVNYYRFIKTDYIAVGNPHYRTIHYGPISTTKYVGAREELVTKPTDNYYLKIIGIGEISNNEEEELSVLCLDDCLIESAKNANLPHLQITPNNKAFLDFRRDIRFKYDDKANSNIIKLYQLEKVKPYPEHLSKTEAQAIIDWIKGY